MRGGKTEQASRALQRNLGRVPPLASTAAASGSVVGHPDSKARQDLRASRLSRLLLQWKDLLELPVWLRSYVANLLQAQVSKSFHF